MIAEKAVPEAVGYEKIKGVKEARFLDYTRLVPLMVEAIKEQQKQIEKLNSKLDRIWTNVETEKSKNSATIRVSR